MDRHSVSALVTSAALFALAALTVSCASTPDAGAAWGDKTLAEAYRDCFPIGAAVAAGEYGFDSFTAYSPRLLSEFSSLTAENAMKPSVIQPERGRFSWTAADKIVKYAKERSLKVRGHTLVWHNQTPSWFFKTDGSVEERRAWARTVMREHMSAVMGRYKGAIYAWDVVNEAVADNPGKSIYREDSPWYKMWGDATYVREAFIIARSIDPDALLFYNDYGMDNPIKRERVVQMLTEQGIIKDKLIDGIGLQGHWGIQWPNADGIQDAVDELSETGLTLQITELDLITPKGSEPLLAERYAEIFRALKANKDKISGVTFWGVADDHTWLNDFHGYKNYPFLFGENRLPKKAYYRVREAN